jgi:hypothetical protein
VLAGIFITALTYKEAEKNSKVDPIDNVSSGRMFGGEHD